MKPHKELRDFLNSKNYLSLPDSYGEEFYCQKIFDLFDLEANNQKGGLNNSSNYFERFRDIISDPNNLFIKRVDDAGKVVDNIITLHNGIKLHFEYYDDFVNILKYNLGVHEPSEERVFNMVLNHIDDNSVMVELGSYWCMYSICFAKKIKNSKTYCIEPIETNIELGKKNFILNDLTYDITKGFVSNDDINLKNFFEEKGLDKIDILHSDIQGNELIMLQQIESYLREKKIEYIFLSTHSDSLHYSCVEYLKSLDYEIICSSDFNSETYSYDGFLLAHNKKNTRILPFYIGNRKKSFLISENTLREIIESSKK